MAQLQGTVSQLQGTLAKIQKEPDIEKIRELLTVQQKSQKGSRRLPVSIATSAGSYSIFGPTSAFHNVVDMSSHTLAETFDSGLTTSSLLIVCLSNFFRWQYPDIATFIHRESFLNDFLGLLLREYCSEELVYAAAALGAKCSDDDEIRALAPAFFETAKSKILSKKVWQPHITTLQALLCLSLYELGDGNASASWMLSGMAFRMGYDLGFQLNPREWTTEDHQEIVTSMDVMVRSRIYWGCYVFDHFVSLVMGRPVTVRKSEASIPSSEHLPNSEGIESFVFQPPTTPEGVPNVDASASLLPLCSLSECVGSLLLDIFSTDGDDAYLPKSKIGSYNTFLADWRRDLPVEMRWTKRSLRKQAYNPTLNFRLYYYVVLLCLNRPFMSDQDQESSTLCSSATSELVICLSQYNASGYPPSVLIVYASVLAISVLLMRLHSEEKSLVSSLDIADLEVLYACVSRSCSSWKLASKSLQFIRRRVVDLGLSEVSKVFGPAERDATPTSTQAEAFESEQMDDSSWGYNDNLITNFFDFLNYDGIQMTDEAIES